MGEPRAFGGLARGPWAGGRVIAGPFAGCYSRIQHDLALAAMAERQRWAWMAGPRASSSASSCRSRSAPSGSVSGVTPGRGRAESQVWQIFDGMRRHAHRVSADILKEEERLEAAFRATTITEPDLRLCGSPPSKGNSARSTSAPTSRRARSGRRPRSPATTNSAATRPPRPSSLRNRSLWRSTACTSARAGSPGTAPVRPPQRGRGRAG